MAKTASLDQFQVNRKDVPAREANSEDRSNEKQKGGVSRRYVTKGFQVTRDAALQFDILKAERGPNSGPALIGEALNLLFKKYNKATIA